MSPALRHLRGSKNGDFGKIFDILSKHLEDFLWKRLLKVGPKVLTVSGRDDHGVHGRGAVGDDGPLLRIIVAVIGRVF
jgi:hypothetical protein